MTQTITIKQTRDNLADIINQVAYTGKTFIVTKYGQPQAKISPAKQTLQKHENKVASQLMSFKGMWAHRKDIKNSVEFAKELRRKASTSGAK